MRCLVQRVLSASVSVEGKTIGSIEKGYLVLLGVKNTDTEAVADKLLKKILDARLFEDDNGKGSRHAHRARRIRCGHESKPYK